MMMSARSTVAGTVAAHTSQFSAREKERERATRRKIYRYFI